MPWPAPCWLLMTSSEQPRARCGSTLTKRIGGWKRRGSTHDSIGTPCDLPYGKPCTSSLAPLRGALLDQAVPQGQVGKPPPVAGLLTPEGPGWVTPPGPSLFPPPQHPGATPPVCPGRLHSFALADSRAPRCYIGWAKEYDYG